MIFWLSLAGIGLTTMFICSLLVFTTVKTLWDQHHHGGDLVDILNPDDINMAWHDEDNAE